VRCGCSQNYCIADAAIYLQLNEGSLLQYSSSVGVNTVQQCCYMLEMFMVLSQNIILTLNLLTSTIIAPPSNASKWQMGFNSAFKGLIVISPTIMLLLEH
jgi:hypothetical protein